MRASDIFALGFENLRSGALLVEKSSGRVMEANAAFLRICGRPRGDVVGRNFWAPPLIDDVRSGAEVFAHLRARGRVEGAELPLQTGDGTCLLLELNGTELAGGVLQLEIRDATGRAAAHTADRMDAQRTLAARSAMQFAALSELLANRETDAVRKAAGRAREVARELRSYSGQSLLETRPLHLNALIQRMQPEVERILGPGIQMVTGFDADASPVLADPAQLRQIVLELAANSRAAMEHGGKFHILTRNAPPNDPALGRPAGPYVVLEIGDDGPGLDEQSWDHLFEPFFTTGAQGKLGLGLAAVHGAVRQMQGRLWVDSQPEKGTSFRIYLPLTTAQPVLQGPPTILLVEQNGGLRTVVANILKKRGYRVLTAGATAGALEIARTEGPPDLLITEPEPELARTLAGWQPRLRTLFLNGHSNHGGVPAISQPFEVETLLGKVRELLPL